MQDLWQNDTAPVRGAEEILARTERLKTIIRQRTLREFSGAIVVVLFFAAAALLAATAFARLAAALIAGLTLCIALVSRFREEQRYADPTLASIQYGRDALSAYSEQIERLSRLRHWYSVPAIIGLTFLAANAFADKNATAIVILQLAAMAIAFGLVWVLDLSLGPFQSRTRIVAHSGSGVPVNCPERQVFTDGSIEYDHAAESFAHERTGVAAEGESCVYRADVASTHPGLA